MQFNSLHFLIFFPLVTIVYFIIPKRLRWIWLLIASYYFYMSWNARYALLIALSTLITYLSGIGQGFINSKYKDNAKEQKQLYKKLVVAISFITNISILVFFKYFDFLIENINILLNGLGMTILEKPFDIILPVGISFYTFQALSYTTDF